MREKLLALAGSKQQVAVNFAAADVGKLISTNGTVLEVGDDYLLMKDLYGNTMLIPFTAIAYVDIKK